MNQSLRPAVGVLVWGLNGVVMAAVPCAFVCSNSPSRGNGLDAWYDLGVLFMLIAGIGCASFGAIIGAIVGSLVTGNGPMA